MTKQGTLIRNDQGQFVEGVSGNPLGRPKGSKNKITLLRQSLELQLREQAAPDMGAVLQKAVDLALSGDRAMLKLLLEMHIAKGSSDDVNATEKVAIQINNLGRRQDPEVIDITSNEDTENE
jgi:hypothetical protein